MDIKQVTPVVVTRKAVREQIEEALLSLSDLQNVLGKKKFKRRVKQAGKLFSNGLPKSVAVKKQKTKLKKVAEPAA